VTVLIGGVLVVGYVCDLRKRMGGRDVC